MRQHLAAAFAAVAICGCADRDTETRARLAKLETRVADLSEQVRVDQARITTLKVQQDAPSSVELVVTWPSKGGNDYRRPYPSMAACEKAREAIFQENERRRAEAEAEVGTVNAAGVTTFAVGAPATASAFCLP